ncbi:MAG TPA: bile acid:sodium symporter family protein [Pseudomonadales bacterium]
MLLKLFPLLAAAAGALGWGFAGSVAHASGAIVPLLMLIMLCMGLTLTPQDFLNLRHCKSAVLAGVTLQFSAMPLTALGIARLLGLDDDLTVGLVLVGSVAGGTASNVITYLARGNVALSVSMTSISTLASVLLTPLLVTLLVGSRVPVPAGELLTTLAQIIVVPVLVGLAINTFARDVTRRVLPALAPLSIAAILIIIAIVVALNADRLGEVGITAAAATLIHNVAGLSLGYLAAYLLGFDRSVCRTIAIEVGMQNSGLAAALAVKFFGAAAALPGSLFSVWQNVTGSAFAALAQWQTERAEPTVGAASGRE